MGTCKMNVTALDNKNLEDKLTLGKQYEVKGETTGDFYDYYLLLCNDGSEQWVEKYRVAESKKDIRDKDDVQQKTVEVLICL